MRSLSSFLALACLTVRVSGSVEAISGIATKPGKDQMTKSDLIASTVTIVNQKGGGASDKDTPGHPVRKTTITALDGAPVSLEVSSLQRRANGNVISSNIAKRMIDGYEIVFDGTGTLLTDRDASIEGTAYLTYTVVSNTTYNIDACLEFCNQVDGCVFANLFYEYNNELLDLVFSEHSNLKCAAYADIHAATEKINFGGQQSYPSPADLTYIQQSSGYAALSLAEPPNPDGYELVYGPTNGANNAPGYMGFAFIDRYDVDACAELCNTRGADPIGGACQYFNIWRALVNGVPITYSCSMYYLVADESTAVNTGQGDLRVTYSRGYSRKPVLTDGDFEDFSCTGNDTVCTTQSYANWVVSSTNPNATTIDATILHDQSSAYRGSGVGVLGTQTDPRNAPGALTPAQPLNTVAGTAYTVTFFASSRPTNVNATLSGNSTIQVVWNGAVVGSVAPITTNWMYYETTVTAQGSDVLTFQEGCEPAYTLVDNVFVFQLCNTTYVR
ncbi:hypothetical protein AMATHDRAFT_76043 [Amanita thiersii Skay4041]|uniref:CBM-cenC domain-containing protein n=1 Tax=Amanita thiersii Skay4041 TaxID=703135 RepID=A0A2A9NPP9_9AGAR|nr:hypothetical protein AMATHDRAFT_76043 [Amanita thiersii Skay4041]